jgi:hypothetical protein
VNHDFRSRVSCRSCCRSPCCSRSRRSSAPSRDAAVQHQDGSLMLAAVAAGGILFTVSLAASQDKLDAPAAGGGRVRRGAAAAGRRALLRRAHRRHRRRGPHGNVQPLLVVPEDAPVIAPRTPRTSACRRGAAARPVDRLGGRPRRGDRVRLVRVREPRGRRPHNVVITDLEGRSTTRHRRRGVRSLRRGHRPVVDDYYVADEVTWEDLPEEWYFYCAVHPNMNGVGTVVDRRLSRPRLAAPRLSVRSAASPRRALARRAAGVRRPIVGAPGQLRQQRLAGERPPTARAPAPASGCRRR